MVRITVLASPRYGQESGVTSWDSKDIIVKLVSSSRPRFFILRLQLDEETLSDVRNRTCLRHICVAHPRVDIWSQPLGHVRWHELSIRYRAVDERREWCGRCGLRASRMMHGPSRFWPGASSWLACRCALFMQHLVRIIVATVYRQIPPFFGIRYTIGYIQVYLYLLHLSRYTALPPPAFSLVIIVPSWHVRSRRLLCSFHLVHVFCQPCNSLKILTHTQLRDFGARHSLRSHAKVSWDVVLVYDAQSPYMRNFPVSCNGGWLNSKQWQPVEYGSPCYNSRL